MPFNVFTHNPLKSYDTCFLGHTVTEADLTVALTYFFLHIVYSILNIRMPISPRSVRNFSFSDFPSQWMSVRPAGRHLQIRNEFAPARRRRWWRGRKRRKGVDCGL